MKRNAVTDCTLSKTVRTSKCFTNRIKQCNNYGIIAVTESKVIDFLEWYVRPLYYDCLAKLNGQVKKFFIENKNTKCCEMDNKMLKLVANIWKIFNNL